MESSQNLFAKMYEQSSGDAGNQGGAGPDMGGDQSSSNGSEAGYDDDDDVIDADYKEV